MRGYLYIIAIGLKIALAFIPANIAKKKGYSFWVFFVFGAIVFLPALLTIYFLKDKLSSGNNIELSQLVFNENNKGLEKTCYICGSDIPRDINVCPLCKAKINS